MWFYNFFNNLYRILNWLAGIGIIPLALISLLIFLACILWPKFMGNLLKTIGFIVLILMVIVK